MNAQNAQPRVNPRSIGLFSAQTYEKHAPTLNLKPEALELARCHDQHIKTEHIETPKLISFNESENRLVTQRVDAQELFATVWNPTYLLGRLRGHKLPDPNTLRSRIIEVGVWLRKYHNSSIKKHRESSWNNWLETDFHRKIYFIRENRLMPEAKLIKIEKQFGPELSNLNQAGYPADSSLFPCQVHGDFLIYNILIDSDQHLYVLDFGDTRVSANLDDVVRFYSGLRAIAHTNSNRYKLLGDLPMQFLQSYGLRPEIIDTPYFRCSMAYNALIQLTGQFCMKSLISWNTNRELTQITRAGLNWIHQQL